MRDRIAPMHLFEFRRVGLRAQYPDFRATAQGCRTGGIGVRLIVPNLFDIKAFRAVAVFCPGRRNLAHLANDARPEGRVIFW